MDSFLIVLIYCIKLDKISLNYGGSYIDSPEWLKNKKATINPKNNDNKCFQYAVTVALNYQSIKNNPERITKIMSFINQYNWRKISCPSHKKDRKKFESNNKSIAFNVLYVAYNSQEIRHTYKSKYNLKSENQIIILMITENIKKHFLTAKNLSSLLQGMTSNYFEDFFCWNCFHSFSTENKLKKHEKVCNNHHYCYIEIPKEYNKILKYNHGEKPVKIPFIIHADMEYFLEKINTCYEDHKKSSTTKINIHIPSGY